MIYSNWKTEGEAKRQACMMPSGAVGIRHQGCVGSMCGHWVWAGAGVNYRFSGVQTPPEGWRRPEEDSDRLERVVPLGGCGLRRLP